MSLKYAYPGKPTKFEISTQVPPEIAVDWTTLGDIHDISTLPLKIGEQDTTTFGDSYFRDHTKTVFEEVKLVLSVYYTEPVFSAWNALLEERNSDRWYRLQWFDTFAEAFMAMVTDIEITTPRDEVITFDATVTVSDMVVYGGVP